MAYDLTGLKYTHWVRTEQYVQLNESTLLRPKYRKNNKKMPLYQIILAYPKPYASQPTSTSPAANF